MDLSRGFVLLARSIDKSDIFQNEKWLKIWIWCLIQANHKDKNVPIKIGKSVTVVKIRRGQFVFGRLSASKKLKMKPSTVRNIMEKLVKLKNIDMQKDRHYSIVTIVNYELYQNFKTFEDSKEDNRRTTEGQPKDTTNTPNTPNTLIKYIVDKNSLEYKICFYLYNMLLKSDPDLEEPNWTNWCKDMDLFLRRDKPKPTDIKTVIDHAHNPKNSTDNFSWIPNLRSPKKLRKHFKTILLQIRNRGPKYERNRNRVDWHKEFEQNIDSQKNCDQNSGDDDNLISFYDDNQADA